MLVENPSPCGSPHRETSAMAAEEQKAAETQGPGTLPQTQIHQEVPLFPSHTHHILESELVVCLLMMDCLTHQSPSAAGNGVLPSFTIFPAPSQCLADSRHSTTIFLID